MKTPIVATPIQDVQLLDYVVAHETINESQNYLAGTEDIYTGLFDEDPYTSQEQRQRDQYELDNENWNEVVFEEVLGSSTAKMALHSDWIAQKRYDVHKVVHLELPEQGISGSFLITSIKHILPQKRPVDENPGDSYDFSPVTAIFTHQSDQVYEVRFDNGETLGVTYQHPIYSLTYGDWRLAGELEVGEEVLTKTGRAFVAHSEQKAGSEVVYNLEVKEVHNFLVGDAGVVVHNACLKEYLDLFFQGVTGNYTRKKVSQKQWVDYIHESGIPDAGEIQQLEDLGNKLQKRMVGLKNSILTNRDFPGIDGLIDGGNSISLKSSNGTEGVLRNELKKIATKANKLNDGNVGGHGDWKGALNMGIDGMMSSTTHSKNVIQSKWNSVLGDHQINTDLVQNLYVQASDGWLKWSRADGWVNF